MTLGFSTKWPKSMGDLAGQPNYFPEKIVASVRDLPDTEHGIVDFLGFERVGYSFDFKQCYNCTPKLHTIREDQRNRWKPGMVINFVIFNRTKNRFEFSRAKCTGVQEIEIKQHKFPHNFPVVYVGSTGSINTLSLPQIKQLASNDGFPSVEAFFQWFNEDFSGKILHWTNLRY